MPRTLSGALPHGFVVYERLPSGVPLRVGTREAEGVRDGSAIWVTPDDSSGALPGVTRNRLLALGREDEKLHLTEGRVQIGDLARCTEVCLSNSTGRILPVTEVLGRAAALPGRHGAGYRQLVTAMDSIEARYAQGARARRAGGRGPWPGG